MNLGRYVRTIYVPRRQAERPIPVPDWPRRRTPEPVWREAPRREDANAYPLRQVSDAGD